MAVEVARLPMVVGPMASTLVVARAGVAWEMAPAGTSMAAMVNSHQLMEVEEEDTDSRATTRTGGKDTVRIMDR